MERRKKVKFIYYSEFHVTKLQLSQLKSILPKIQKGTSSVSGRPVISNNSTATENISAFLDYHLKPLVIKVPHVLEDTRDFLTQITEIKDLPEDALLVSLDVVDYTRIFPMKRAMRLLRNF